MFNSWFSGVLRSWYLQSVHKERIDQTGTHLLRLNYRPVVVRQHLHEWARFGGYLADRALPLPASFHETVVQRYVVARVPRGSASRRRGIRASIRIFLDIDANGRFPRRRLASPRPTNALFDQAVPAYLDFHRKHRGLSARTLSKRAFQLILFTEYLDRLGVSTWKDSQPSAVRTFLVTQLTGIKPTTRLSYASTLRSFLRWAYLHGLLERDFSTAAAAVRQYRLAGLPDLLTDVEVAALLGATDRSTALGKRDFAVLVLAARYGMRPSDIRQLSLDHIDWRGRQIALPQALCEAERYVEYLGRARAFVLCACRTLYITPSQGLEPFEDIWRDLSRSAWLLRWRAGLFQRFPFCLQICVYVDFGRSHIRVTQHIFYRDDRHAGLQQVHGFGVTERVETDPDAVEPRQHLRCLAQVLPQQVASPLPGKLFLTPILE